MTSLSKLSTTSLNSIKEDGNDDDSSTVSGDDFAYDSGEEEEEEDSLDGNAIGGFEKQQQLDINNNNNNNNNHDNNNRRGTSVNEITSAFLRHSGPTSSTTTATIIPTTPPTTTTGSVTMNSRQTNMTLSLKSVSWHTPQTTRQPQHDFLPLQPRSDSYHSPKKTTTTQQQEQQDSAIRRRKVMEVDGMPLQHWNKNNFIITRDQSCRIVYEPKDDERNEFYYQNLSKLDYQILRGWSTTTNSSSCRSRSFSVVWLEQPYYSKYNRFFPQCGHFACKACGNPLYSHDTKFDAEDGYPAFGACVEGAIGVIPSSSKKQQQQQHYRMTKREEKACIKIQAFVRGALCRITVTKMVDNMIQQLLLLQQQQKQQCQEKGKEQGQSNQKSTTNLDNRDIQDSFTTNVTESIKVPLFSPTKKDTVIQKKKVGNIEGLKYALQQQSLEDDYTEIHCHRCKSHLGNVMIEENRGKYGKVYQERHRVNGRCIKYVYEELSKRLVTESSLLFVTDATKRKLLGLPSPNKTKTVLENYSIRHVPLFISPRTQRRQQQVQQQRLSTDWKPTNLLCSISCHPNVQRASGTKLKRGGFDPLNATSHEPGRTSRRLLDPLRISCHERTMPQNQQPKNIDDTKSHSGGFRIRKVHGAVNVQEKKASLEQFFNSKSVNYR